jgi:hypothetical protein
MRTIRSQKIEPSPKSGWQEKPFSGDQYRVLVYAFHSLLLKTVGHVNAPLFPGGTFVPPKTFVREFPRNIAYRDEQYVSQIQD